MALILMRGAKVVKNVAIMVSYLIVGATQTGKTTFAKKNILQKYPNVLVYDVQNQYSELPYWKREKKGRFRVSPVHMEFGKFVLLGQALENFLFVYEEATQFLEGQISKPMKANLVGKAHTGNRFVFFFHAFSQIPPRIIDFCDYLIQFRTGLSDKEGVQKKMRIQEIKDNYIELESLPRFSRKILRVSNLALDNIY